MLNLPDIALLFARHGASQYGGEPVTQLQHALQTAHLAEASEADDALVTACLLDVDAKRYLCQVNPDYFDRLSDDSKRSLALQGGVFSAEQAAAFLQHHGARDAVMLRQWDDLAKQADLATPSLAHFLARAERCVLATPSLQPA